MDREVSRHERLAAAIKEFARTHSSEEVIATLRKAAPYAFSTETKPAARSARQARGKK